MNSSSFRIIINRSKAGNYTTTFTVVGFDFKNYNPIDINNYTLNIKVVDEA